MRRALTLIELIFSMMIVALVFTVVPKIVFVTNKSFETTVREEALYNAMALMGIVVRLPWDELNTRYDRILAVTAGNGAYRCDESTGFYRIGGFRGSRNCIGSAQRPLEASATLGREGTDYNDLDDYNGFGLVTTTPYGARYDLNVTVRYLEDPDPGDEVDLSLLAPSSGTTDIKEVRVTVFARAKTPFRSSIYYHAANIGQFYLHKRAWR
jgi:hypothetical protein